MDVPAGGREESILRNSRVPTVEPGWSGFTVGNRIRQLRRAIKPCVTDQKMLSAEKFQYCPERKANNFDFGALAPFASENHADPSNQQPRDGATGLSQRRPKFIEAALCLLRSSLTHQQSVLGIPSSGSKPRGLFSL